MRLIRAGESRAGGNFRSIQALRGLACLLVVIFHANHSFFGLPKYWADRPLGDFFEFGGHAGVDYFFVLSGFIIYVAHRHDLGDRRHFARFAWRRFSRVYPVYWIVLLALIPVFFVVPNFGTGIERQAGTIADAFALVHVFGSKTILTVAWTMFHEVAFYAIFAAMIFNFRAGAVVFAAWITVGLMPLAAPSLESADPSTLMSPLHCLFAMGVAAGWLATKQRIAAAPVVAALGVGIIAATAVADVRTDGASNHWPVLTDWLALAYGAGSALLILGCVELERSGRLAMPRLPVFFGDASYSIYLVHDVTMSALAKLALASAGIVALPHLAIFCGLIALSTAAGVAYHLAVEKPLLRALRRVRWPAPSVTAAEQARA